jgi:putative Mg2+ transporter-C (MgtC) family protein
MPLDFIGLPDLAGLGRVTIRLVGAAVLGGLIGVQRERAGKAAGLRTHMMVALGAALFVIVPMESGTGAGDLTRVIQGIAAGMGFLGGGTILKQAEKEQIAGLTSAATIWLTGAVGIAVGAGLGWIAVVCVATAWIILSIMAGVEARLSPRRETDGQHGAHVSSRTADRDR